MLQVGIHPTSIGILNGHPTEIPPDKMLGGVVQNCQKEIYAADKKIYATAGCTGRAKYQLCNNMLLAVPPISMTPSPPTQPASSANLICLSAHQYQHQHQIIC